MPTYAYHCRACENDFEVKQRFSDDPLTECIICETEDAVFRVIQPAGIVFKGSGWYVTDSRGSGSKGAKSSTNGVANKSDTSSENGSSDNGNNGADSKISSEAKASTNTSTSTENSSTSSDSTTTKAASA